MSTWEISGEAGKALDETKRSFEDLSIPDPVVTLASMKADKLTFSQVFSDPADAGGMELTQMVTLWRDGVRFLSGNITDRVVGDSTTGLVVSTVVEGPWWWMEQTPFSGAVQDSAGNTVSRMYFPFDTGDLTVTLTTAINRMITLGVPIQLGTIDAAFDIPAISLANMTCADALADLLRWVPDAVVWFDYSVTTGTGYPTINITRRIVSTAVSFASGAAPVVGVSLAPRLDLKVDQITLLFATHDDQEKTIFVEVLSGHSGTAQSGTSGTIKLAADASDSDDAFSSLDVTIDSGTGAGQTRTISGYDGGTKVATVAVAWTTSPDVTSIYTVGAGSGGTSLPQRQVVPITGPEISDILPKDYFENEEVKSKSIPGWGSRGALATEKDPLISGWIEENGAFAGYSLRDNFYSQNTPITIKRRDGTAASVNYYMVTGEEKAWFDTLGIETEQLTVSGEFAFYQALQTPAPNIVQDLGHDGSFSYGGDWYWRKQLTFQITGVSALWASLTTVYRKQDYEFINPPAGLALNLLNTQNWTPYEGSIELREDEVGGVNYLKHQIHVTNSLPELATMGGLVNEVVMDIHRKSTMIYLGAPARLSYKGLVRRFRQSSRDNIVYL